MSQPFVPDGRTRLLCVFGWPLSYTRSPAFQNAALRARGLNAVYAALPTPDEKSFAGLVRGLQRSPQFVGGNITNPFKVAALKLAERLSPAAKAIGAVNTLVRGPRGWEGHNTDAGGFLAALKAARIPLRGRRVLLLGAGGAARALAWACGQAGAAQVRVLARRLPQARACAKLAGSAGQAALLSPAAVTDQSADADLVLNTLPGAVLGQAMGRALHRGKGAVMDIGYDPVETAFCQRARQLGWRAHNGRSMLLEQGALAFELWFKQKAPRHAMQAALRKV